MRNERLHAICWSVLDFVQVAWVTWPSQQICSRVERDERVSLNNIDAYAVVLKGMFNSATCYHFNPSVLSSETSYIHVAFKEGSTFKNPIVKTERIFFGKDPFTVKPHSQLGS